MRAFEIELLSIESKPKSRFCSLDRRKKSMHLEAIPLLALFPTIDRTIEKRVGIVSFLVRLKLLDSNFFVDLISFGIISENFLNILFIWHVF